MFTGNCHHKSVRRAKVFKFQTSTTRNRIRSPPSGRGKRCDFSEMRFFSFEDEGVFLLTSRESEVSEKFTGTGLKAAVSQEFPVNYR